MRDPANMGDAESRHGGSPESKPSPWYQRFADACLSCRILLGAVENRNCFAARSQATGRSSTHTRRPTSRHGTTSVSRQSKTSHQLGRRGLWSWRSVVIGLELGDLAVNLFWEVCKGRGAYVYWLDRLFIWWKWACRRLIVPRGSRECDSAAGQSPH
jgi:hypothetical protein